MIIGTIELIIIAILIFFQSIFGVGLLIFGTPTFLLLEFSFAETLSILTPLSCCISAIQYFSSKLKINDFKINFFKFSLVGVVIFLPITVYFIKTDNLKTIVSLIMILISLISLNKINLKNFRDFFLKYSKVYLFIMGCIHGLTNLGGGFVSIYSSILYFGDKLRSRKAIALSYFFLGIIQIIILILTKNFYFKFEILFLILITPILYYFSGFIFKKINFEFYIKVLYLLILSYGLFILIF